MKSVRLDNIFIALSHPTRRAMVKKLLRGSASVTELGSLSPISLNSASKHVRILERAGLVRRSRGPGVTHSLTLHGTAFDHAQRWIDDHHPDKRATKRKRR